MKDKVVDPKKEAAKKEALKALAREYPRTMCTPQMN